MSSRREIMLGGLGGQGVIMAGMLLGKAAVADGLVAAGSNSYGAQARGSACKAELVLDAEAIDYPHAETPELLVAMSQGAYQAYAEAVDPEGVILYDSGLVEPRGLRREVGFAVTERVLEVLGSKQAGNVFWMGVLAGYTGWFSAQALHQVVRESFPQRFEDMNLQALDRGLELGRQAQEG
jgi:2-oxoglutarate ferredoxin oxidoreductase subunit gamma